MHSSKCINALQYAVIFIINSICFLYKSIKFNVKNIYLYNLLIILMLHFLCQYMSLSCTVFFFFFFLSSDHRFLQLTCPWMLPSMDFVLINTASLANPNNMFSTRSLPRHLRNIIQYVSDQTSSEHVLSKGHKDDLVFPSIVLYSA